MREHTGNQKPSAFEETLIDQTLEEIQDGSREQPYDNRQARRYPEDIQDNPYERNYYYQRSREDPRYDSDDYFRDSRENGDYYEYR